MKLKVVLIALIAATGGLLFGFDTGVISGALPFLNEDFGLSDGQMEWLTTSVLFGAVIGAICSGRLSDYLGRKKMIIINAVIFTVAAWGCGYAPNYEVLLIMRAVIGIAIGITSYVVPMYIAEVAPASKRGSLVTLNQLMITIGLLGSYISDYLLSDNSNPESWRMMFLVGVFPALILLVGMFFLPETPRWLISKSRAGEAKKVLESIESPEMVAQSFAAIQHDNRVAGQQDSGMKEILKPWLRPALIITVGIFFFQQFSGVNTIIYYSPIIFKMAGITSNSASIIPAIIIGTVNVLACVISVIFLDKVGRRKLYMIGIWGMIPSLALAGACFFFQKDLGGSLIYLSVLSIVCFIFFINISLSPLGWLLISEIFPIKVRGLGMSIGSLSHWGFNAIIAFTFLTLVNQVGMGGTFFLYAGICVLGLLWGHYYIPETKGKTLEEIEEHWRQGKSPKSL